LKTRSRSRWEGELRPGEDHGPPVVIAIQAFVIVLGSLALGWSPNLDVVFAIPALVWRRARSRRTAGAATGTRAWVVLAVWAVVRPVLVATFFRWE
jgi:hypothetical protein